MLVCLTDRKKPWGSSGWWMAWVSSRSRNKRPWGFRLRTNSSRVISCRATSSGNPNAPGNYSKSHSASHTWHNRQRNWQKKQIMWVKTFIFGSGALMPVKTMWNFSDLRGEKRLLQKPTVTDYGVTLVKLWNAKWAIQTGSSQRLDYERQWQWQDHAIELVSLLCSSTFYIVI